MANRLKALRQAWFWRPFSLWQVRRCGASDGKLQPPVPPWEAKDQPPFVMEIKRAGDGDLQLITLAWDQADRELKTRYTEADRHYDQRLQALTKCEEEFTVAVERYEEINQRPAPAVSDKSGWFYVSIATLISIFEIPLNLSFFRLFGESEVLTIVATVGLAFSLMFCAHYLGTMLKQGEFASHTPKILVACMIAFPAVLIGGIAYLRVAYIHQIDETTRTISPTVLLIVSAALNCLMVTVATVAAYSLHEEGRSHVDATRRLLRRAVSAKNSAEKRVLMLEEQRRKAFDAYKTQAQHVKDLAEGLIEAYRTANLKGRGDRNQAGVPSYPASYLEEVVVKIPMPLRASEPPPLNSSVSAKPGQALAATADNSVGEVNQ